MATEARLRVLMLGGLAGDARAYRELLREVSRHLRGYFLRRLGADHAADVEDLVQETLMAIHARRQTYDISRPFTAWLHAIANYKLADHYRARRMTVPLEDADAFVAPDEEGAVLARHDLFRLMESIPERQKGLIHAVRIEGRSVSEVAATQGMSESAVKVAIHRTLRMLSARVKGTRAP